MDKSLEELNNCVSKVQNQIVHFISERDEYNNFKDVAKDKINILKMHVKILQQTIEFLENKE